MLRKRTDTIIPNSIADAQYINQFNGQQTIAEIVSIIQEETGWNLDKSAAVIRNLFLRLCEVRICEPG
jgi:hypothetical protein